MPVSTPGISTSSKLDPLRDGYAGAQLQAFFHKLLDRLPRASLTDSVPMSMIGKPRIPVLAETTRGKTVAQALKYTVDKTYFQTLGIPVIRGRAFREEDETEWSHVALVSERLVDNLWNGQDPIGHQLEIGSEASPQFHMIGPPSSGPRKPAAATAKFRGHWRCTRRARWPDPLRQGCAAGDLPAPPPRRSTRSPIGSAWR